MSYRIKDYSESIAMLYHRDEPVFEALKQELFKLGFSMCGVEFTTISQSCYVIETAQHSYEMVPYVRLIGADHDVYQRSIGQNPNSGLANKELSVKVIQLWKELCERYHLPLEDCYHEQMYVGVEDGPLLVYEYIARTYKKEILAILQEQVHLIPKDIYASSQPSIELVYTKDQYEKIEADMEQMKESVLVWASHIAETLTGQTLKNCLRINFWHPEMPRYNGYGLARQD